MSVGEPPDPALAAILEPTREDVPWRALEGLAIGFVAFLAGGVGALVFGKDGDATIIVGMLAHEIVLFVATVAWVRLVHGRAASDLGLRAPAQPGMSRGLGFGVAGVAIAYTISVAQLIVLNVLSRSPVEAPEQISFDRDPGPGLLALLGFVVVFLAPIAEETFFRGFLHRSVRRWAGPSWAAVISSALFAAVHLIWLVMLPIFALGLILARLADRFGSIVPGILTHMVFNAVGFALLVAFQL